MRTVKLCRECMLTSSYKPGNLYGFQFGDSVCDCCKTKAMVAVFEDLTTDPSDSASKAEQCPEPSEQRRPV